MKRICLISLLCTTLLMLTACGSRCEVCGKSDRNHICCPAAPCEICGESGPCDCAVSATAETQLIPAIESIRPSEFSSETDSAVAEYSKSMIETEFASEGLSGTERTPGPAKIMLTYGTDNRLSHAANLSPGTYSWFVDSGDGTGQGICADSERHCYLKNVIRIERKRLTDNKVKVGLKSTVKSYKLTAYPAGSDYTEGQDVRLQDNILTPLDGAYYYELEVEFQHGNESGTAYYGFFIE